MCCGYACLVWILIVKGLGLNFPSSAVGFFAAFLLLYLVFSVVCVCDCDSFDCDF